MAELDKTPLLEARQIGVSIPTDNRVVEAVRDVSFTLHRGETIALVGESGSGKSMCARTIMRLLPKRAEINPDCAITFNGDDLAHKTDDEMRRLRGRRIAMIFQEPMSSLNPVYKIGTQVAEMITCHNKVSQRDALDRALALLKEVALTEPEARLQQYPHQLSGGQRQRVMIAMALANEPDLLIADEPTTALDVTVQAQILQLLSRLQRERQMGMLLITHDLTIVRQFSDRVYVMRNGVVVEENATADLFAEPTHPYTQHLLASEPKGHAEPLAETAPVALNGEKIGVTFGLKSGGFFSRKTIELRAVNNVDLRVRRGETLGVVGESGSGKTTLGMSLIRLQAAEGAITYDGERLDGLSRGQLKPWRRRIQVVFQDPFSSLNPRLSIQGIIEEGLIVNGIGGSAKERRELVTKALTDAGMPGDILNRFPHEFSGGQRQRIAIARAIALDPDFILLDEPTSALDLSVQAQIIQLLRALQKQRGLSYIFISHDLKVVKAMCHNVMVMRDGDIVEQGPVDEVLERPKTDYTRALMRAAFEIAA